MDLLFKEIDMLSGLEIVLERIKEYPEELPKWADILVDYLQYFTEEEVQAWLDIKIQVGRERFNERVLKHLSGNDVPEQVTGFQNEVSRIVAREMYGGVTIRNAVITGEQQARTYANNNR
jgi:hypothetical protein